MTRNCELIVKNCLPTHTFAPSVVALKSAHSFGASESTAGDAGFGEVFVFLCSGRRTLNLELLIYGAAALVQMGAESLIIYIGNTPLKEIGYGSFEQIQEHQLWRR